MRIFSFFHRFYLIRNLMGGEWWHISKSSGKVWRQSPPVREDNEFLLGGEFHIETIPIIKRLVITGFILFIIGCILMGFESYLPAGFVFIISTIISLTSVFINIKTVTKT